MSIWFLNLIAHYLGSLDYQKKKKMAARVRFSAFNLRS